MNPLQALRMGNVRLLLMLREAECVVGSAYRPGRAAFVARSLAKSFTQCKLHFPSMESAPIREPGKQRHYESLSSLALCCFFCVFFFSFKWKLFNLTSWSFLGV